MLKQILLSLLLLPLMTACDKPQPATPAMPAAPPAAAPTPAPALTPTPTPEAVAPTPASTQKSMSTAPTAPLAGGGDLAKGEGVYKQTCTVCHAMGIAGAPKLTDKANWQPRIAQGKATLYLHAIKGFTGSKGVMPAKGGNTALSDDDVKAAVDYMTSQAK